MKKLTSLLLLAGVFMSCSKNEIIESNSTGNYQIRIAAIENNGARSTTPITMVKSGKVAIEFETAEVSEVKEYKVEVSTDGTNFRSVKTIAADLNNPNRIYTDTIVLE